MWVIVESVSPRMSGLYDLERDGGPATFSELAQKAGSLARGPDSWPTTKSVYQAANPVDRAVRRNLCAHTRTHECGLPGRWAAAALQIEYFAFHPSRGGKSVPGKPAKADGHGWRRTSARFGGD